MAYVLRLFLELFVTSLLFVVASVLHCVLRIVLVAHAWCSFLHVVALGFKDCALLVVLSAIFVYGPPVVFRVLLIVHWSAICCALLKTV